MIFFGILSGTECSESNHCVWLSSDSVALNLVAFYDHLTIENIKLCTKIEGVVFWLSKRDMVDYGLYFCDVFLFAACEYRSSFIQIFPLYICLYSGCPERNLSFIMLHRQQQD